MKLIKIGLFMGILIGLFSFSMVNAGVNYAFHTTTPSSYGTTIVPPFTSTWWNAENPPQNKIRLTNGDRLFMWANVDGWDGDTTPHIFTIDLGSVRTDIKSVVLWAIPDSSSGISDVSTGTVYGATDTTSGYTLWGDLTTIDSRVNVVGTATAKAWFWESGTDHSAQWIQLDLQPASPGGWFLFAEIEVWNDAFTYSVIPTTVPRQIWEFYSPE